MKKIKNILCCLVACLMLFSVVGCGNNNREEAAGMDISKHVKLVYYVFGSGGDLTQSPAVFQEVNKIVNREINATVEFKVFSYLDYANKLQLAMNSGENFDMCFIAPWLVPMNYQSAVANKYLADITSLLPTCAPDIYKSLSNDIWNAAKIDNKIYGIINEQVFARTGAVCIEDTLLTDNNLTSEDFKQFEDVEKVLKIIKEDSAISPNGKVPYTTFAYGDLWQNMYSQVAGYDDLTSGALTPGVVKFNDTTATVINQFETSEYERFVNFCRKIIDEGYVYADDILNNRVATANQRVRVPGTYKPGVEVSLKEEVSNKRSFTQIMFGEPILTTGSVTASMFAVNSRSTNPERALMFQNLLFKNKELYNLFALGIEGRHYNFTSESKDEIEFIKNSGYKFGADWSIGAETNAYRKKGQPINIVEQTKEINKNSKKSVAFGFVFNPRKVNTKIVACNLITKKYNTAFEQGKYSFEELPIKLSAMKEELIRAGANDIISEKQAQLNEYIANKN